MFSGAKNELFWIISGKFAAVVASLVFVKVMTEYMSVTAFGTLSLLLAIVGSSIQFLFGGISQGITRFYIIAIDGDWFSDFIYTSIKLLFFAILMSGFFVFVLFQWFLSYDQLYNFEVVLFTIIFLLASGITTAFSGLQNAARQRKIVALHTAIGQWLKILIFLIFAYHVTVGVEIALASIAIAAALILCSQFYFANNLISSVMAYANSSPTLLKSKFRYEIFEFSWPISVWGIFTGIHLMSDRYLLNYFHGAEQVAYYSVLFQVGYTPILTLLALVTNYFAPVLYEKTGSGEDLSRVTAVRREINTIKKYVIALTFLCFIIASFTHEIVFNILVSDEYLKISYLLPFILLAGGMFSLGQVFALQMMIDKRNRQLLGIKVFSACVGIVGNVVLSMAFSIVGTVASLSLFAAVFLLSTMFHDR